MRRRQKTTKIESDNLTIVHANVRGLKSKIDSVGKIVKLFGANMICLNKHHVIGKSKVEIQGFKLSPETGQINRMVVSPSAVIVLMKITV